MTAERYYLLLKNIFDTGFPSLGSFQTQILQGCTKNKRQKSQHFALLYVVDTHLSIIGKISRKFELLKFNICVAVIHKSLSSIICLRSTFHKKYLVVRDCRNFGSIRSAHQKQLYIKFSTIYHKIKTKIIVYQQRQPQRGVIAVPLKICFFIYILDT